MSTMKFVLAFLCLPSFVAAQERISFEDRSQISDTMEAFVSAVNNKDHRALAPLFASDRQDLLAEVRDKMNGLTSYVLSYNTSGESLEAVDGGNKVKVVGKYAESSPGYEVSGLSTYFTFEKRGDEWVIVDTDFATEVSFMWLFLLLIPIMFIFIALIIFWVRMLIDCADSNLKYKKTWLIFLVLLNIPAAIVYYFGVKRNWN